MRLSRWLATLPVCAVFIMISAASAAEEPHFPSSEDLRHVKALGGPQLSPDGKFVLFSVTVATAVGAKAHIWVVSSSGGTDTLRQLTFSPPSDKRGEHNPQWAPDGGAILFVAKRGEQTQLFRLDMRGGEAAPHDLKVQAVVDESKQKDAKADAAWVNHDPHGTRLYLASLKPDGSIDGTLKPTAVESNVHNAIWSPTAD